MVIKKKAKTFNDYDVQLSWGQLEVVAAALERDHSDPVADELHAELHWYMERVPGPGEEEEDAKAREQGGQPVAQQGEEGDMPIPMPPGEEGGATQPGAQPGAQPGGAEGGELEAPPAEGENEGAGEVTPASVTKALSGEAPVPEPGLEGGGGEEDERLPAPPAE